MNRVYTQNLSLRDVYRNLFPWGHINDFVSQIKSTIAYKSPDNSLIAICKPFGVGTYQVNDSNLSKQNPDRILYRLTGHPKYCISDALKPLSDELSPASPYQVLKSIDRYMSGLVLLSNNFEQHRKDFVRSLSSSRAQKVLPYGMRAITSGYPLIKGNSISEKVGLEFIEVDELGDYKEPIIVQNPTKKHKSSTKGGRSDKSQFRVELMIKKVNREYSTALVEVFATNLRANFARCYISSKTSFILGDVHFSKRIREILGKPIQVSAFKSSHRYDDNYEPLNSKLRELLGVSKNASLPLMLDLHAIRLKGFDRKQKKRDLFIQSPYMPVHFALTAERLNLLDDLSSRIHNGNNDYDVDTSSAANDSDNSVGNNNKVGDTVA